MLACAQGMISIAIFGDIMPPALIIFVGSLEVRVLQMERGILYKGDLAPHQ